MLKNKKNLLSEDNLPPKGYLANCELKTDSKITPTLTDAAEREQRANLFALCRAARRKRPRSGINALNRRCGARAEGKLVCAMPSRKEEKTAQRD